jgi:hypothetical protein
MKKPPSHIRPRVQCTARSKRSQQQCRAWAYSGALGADEPKCAKHGGTTQGRPNTAVITHGQRSEFIRVDAIPAIIADAEKLRSADGKLDLLSINAATIKARAQTIPDDPKFLGVLIQAHHSMRSDVMALAEVEQAKAEAKEAPPTVFNIVNYGDPDGPFRRFQSRGLDGPVLIQHIEGRPYVWDEATDTYHRAVEQIDEDSGASFWILNNAHEH